MLGEGASRDRHTRHGEVVRNPAANLVRARLPLVAITRRCMRALDPVRTAIPSQRTGERSVPRLRGIALKLRRDVPTRRAQACRLLHAVRIYSIDLLRNGISRDTSPP